jgi:Second Messenger Oligonucleotide or Dinucleotide Synthetase domain
MALADWFQGFCANLQITKTESISRRYHMITKRLNLDYWDTDSDSSHGLYVGSYGRNTAIESVSDIDMIFQLPYSIYQQYNAHEGNGQSSLLQAVRASIKKTYSNTEVGADGQIILVPFDDGITFEVVPGFINDDQSYTHPDATDGGSWKITNPRAEIEAIRERNAACNNNLFRLGRMLRSWKDTWSVPIGGLLIDTLAYQFIENWNHRDKSFLYYDFMSRDCFQWMAAQDENQEWWKAPGSGSYVYGKGLFQYKAKRCYNISVDAIANEQNQQEWAAKQKWREIFGTSFPN